MSNDKFKQDRMQALEEMRVALDKFVVDRSLELYKTYDERTAILPEHVKVYEIFRAAALAMSTVAKLMKDEDTAGTDARRSALDGVLKALHELEINFERDYKELTREQLAYWRKKHPLDDASLQIAWKENQRYFMKEALAEMRALVNGVVFMQPSQPKAQPKAPKPPQF